MSGAAEDRQQAAYLPEGDVIRILLEQHARIRDLFDEIGSATGEKRQQAFDQLRELLAIHETAEEIVLRPVSSDTAGAGVTDARNAEEAEANKVLAELEKMDIDSIDFAQKLAEFRHAVEEHAEAEESQEFPTVVASCDAETRGELGRKLLHAEAHAPTHPHPSTAGSPTAVKVAGPFAAMLDRAKDALHRAGM